MAIIIAENWKEWKSMADQKLQEISKKYWSYTDICTNLYTWLVENSAPLDWIDRICVRRSRDDTLYVDHVYGCDSLRTLVISDHNWRLEYSGNTVY